MSHSDRGFMEVLSDTDPFRGGRDEPPRIEVREETRKRRRSGPVKRSDPKTSYRFVVVDNHEREVLYETRWTTGDHHYPYENATGRAVGYANGYQAALPDE